MQDKVRVSALASGSSGNAFLIEVGAIRFLIDAGLNAPKLEYYLKMRGVAASGLSAIFVSHEHIDHLRGVGVLSRRYNLPVVATAGTFRAGRKLSGLLPQMVIQQPGSEMGLGDVRIRSFAVSHDAAETVGYLISAAGHNICICTDLGCETHEIREPLAAADLIVLEANHDIERLWNGSYPMMLKKRVAGPRGHLSNFEAGRITSELAQDGRPRTVWLAHLSAVNNTPELAREAVTAPLRRDECNHISLAVLQRDRPSEVWESDALVPDPAPEPIAV